ncbi:hypothetical protein MB27_03950 [Actinoplanes utahensis]|uniref:SGNH hydrolase-type esterase domain-containing protein n=1 Tax=Actinoplanes utahensis TaxID=1869 RepID=A0A0A6UV39_ACTUT|nr:hypothetical protein MB27_03950 [Actinoplanes utahensis]
MHRAVTRRGLLLGSTSAAVVLATPSEAAFPDPVRVGTWTCVPTAVPPASVLTLEGGHTVRQVIHVSVGGDLPRVTLTNEYGAEPVRIGAARLALRAGVGDSCDTVPGTDRPLTFGGAAETVLRPGEALTSDAVRMAVKPGEDLVLSLYLPERTVTGTVSPRARQTNMILPGDETTTTVVRLLGARRVNEYLWVRGVSVRTAHGVSAIAAFGDSITSGIATTENANVRWPDLLAARLRAAGRSRGVLNAGLSGNRLFYGYEDPTGRAAPHAYIGAPGVRRFDRDVLTQPGVRDVVTLIGVNDLAHDPNIPVARLIAGHRDLIRRATAAGIRITGGTLLPFGSYQPIATRSNLAKREELNAWIRTSGEYPAVIDFDAAVRDPADPQRLLPDFDAGDGLHPNDAGTAALAEAVPLEILA